MTRQLREQQTLAQNPKLTPTPCPVEALAREHKRCADIHVRSIPTDTDNGIYELAGQRMSSIEEAAAAMRATSPGGALFQLTAVTSAISDLEECEGANGATIRRAWSAVFSIVSVLEALSGEDRSAFSGDYATPVERDPHTVADRLPSVTNA